MAAWLPELLRHTSQTKVSLLSPIMWPNCPDVSLHQLVKKCLLANLMAINVICYYLHVGTDTIYGGSSALVIQSFTVK